MEHRDADRKLRQRPTAGLQRVAGHEGPRCSFSREVLPSPMHSTPRLSPDDNASGFLATRPPASRYDNADESPHEAAALLAEFVPEGCRVLDVGCGTGSVSSVVRRLRKVRIVGVEPDAERACLARARGIDVVDGCLTSELVATLGTFDAVLFADVLEHLPNPSALLQLACSVLDGQGIVVLSVPNVAHWSVRWNLLRGRFDYEQHGIMDGTHLRWFTAKSLVGWLLNNGLRVDQMTHSAGTVLGVYRAWPWRSIRRDRRCALVRHLAKRWPLLFGCQHIVRASRIAP